MSLNYEPLRHSPDMISQRIAELIAERVYANLDLSSTTGKEIARVRSIVGEPTWTAVVSQHPELTLAQVDAVALALGTTTEWLMGSDTAPRRRPNLEAELVAGMAKYDLCEADVADALGISRDLLEHTVASPHLVSPQLVNNLLQVLA